MRRTILLAIMVAVALPLLFSASADTSLEMTGYRFKAVELPQLNYSVTIRTWTQAEITGIMQVHDISDSFDDLSFENVFSINIKSNRRADIEVEIDFYPFTHKTDSSNKAPIRYNFLTDPFETVTGQTYGNRSVSGWRYTYYFYRFTPSLKLVSNGTEINGTTALEVGASGASATLVHSVAKIEQASSSSNSVPAANSSSWKEIQDNSYTNITLPFGSGSTQVLETTGYFTVSMDSDTYAAMDANVDYYATVRLTFTSI